MERMADRVKVKLSALHAPARTPHTEAYRIFSHRCPHRWQSSVLANSTTHRTPRLAKPPRGVEHLLEHRPRLIVNNAEAHDEQGDVWGSVTLWSGATTPGGGTLNDSGAI